MERSEAGTKKHTNWWPITTKSNDNNKHNMGAFYKIWKNTMKSN